MPQVPFHSIFQPRACLDRRVGVHFKISNQNPEYITKLGSISVFEPHILPLYRAQVGLKFSEENPISCPSSFPVHFKTTGLSRLLSRVPSENFQPKKPIHHPPRIHLRNFPGNLHGLFQAHTCLRPKYIYIMFTQPHPSTHPSYHPYQPPTITSSTRPTSTPSHTWAIPGCLGRPHGSHCTLYSMLDPITGSSPGCSRLSSRV